jgi:nucleoside 2-deoxyribosyltransferase
MNTEIKITENPYVYLAGPFFNEIQTRRVENIKDILDDLGIDYFSPKDECMFTPGITTPKEVLDMNMNALLKTDLLVCITDDKDTGTMFEAGYCHAMRIPILYVWTTAQPGQKFNIMLAASGAIAKNYADLKLALEDIQERGMFSITNWSDEEHGHE